MKKIFALMLALCVLLSLCACGASGEPAKAETIAPVETTQPETEPVTEAAAEETAPEPAEADPKTIAAGLIDAPVAELYEAIGYPESSDYAPSCLKQGAEDGNLYYDGFIVYTIRDGEEETVYYVE